MILEFKGFIRNISYSPKFANVKNLEEYNLKDFDSNKCASFGRINVNENNHLYYKSGLYKWDLYFFTIIFHSPIFQK